MERAFATIIVAYQCVLVTTKITGKTAMESATPVIGQ